jgi:DNA-binding NarL/FixJ family response regulator
LFLSQHTVKNHVSSILVKLQVQNRIQAAVRAVRQGLV